MLSSKTAPRWLVSARYDMTYFIASGLLVLPLSALYSVLARRGGPLGVDGVLTTYFVFAALLDHPHIFQSFSRTLLDRDEYQRHRWLHSWGVVAFVVGGYTTLALGLERILIVVAAFYGTWHIIRQHWGFLRLYRSLHGEFERRDSAIDSVVFYGVMVGIWIVGFGDIDGDTVVYGELTAPFPATPGWLSSVALVGSLVLLLGYGVYQVVRWRRSRTVNLPKLLLLAAAFSTHAYVYVWTDLPFLVGEAIETIYHDVQYQGFIRHYQNRRHGRSVTRRFLRWALLYGLVAGLVECLALAHRELRWLAVPFAMIVLYHYYADGRIWRFSRAPELRASLLPRS